MEPVAGWVALYRCSDGARFANRVDIHQSSDTNMSLVWKRLKLAADETDDKTQHELGADFL